MVLCIAVTMSMLSVNIFAGTKEHVKEYRFNTIKELKNELKAKGKVARENESVQEYITENSSPEVLVAFIEEKTRDALLAMNAIDIDAVMEETADGNLYGKEVINIGDGCQAIVEFEDCAEPTLLSTMSNYLFEPAFAATNGEVMWKDYGDRYFTASTLILTGVGGSTCKLENHYKLSAAGIDERFGDAYVSGGFRAGITGLVDAADPIIIDQSARTPGSSDVNMYARFSWHYSGAGVLTKQGNTKLSTTVDYVAINKTTKQIKVKHSWTVKTEMI